MNRRKLSVFFALTFVAGVLGNLATADDNRPRDPLPINQRRATNDSMTMVVATRFVRLNASDALPRQQFENMRVPLSELNETDHCVDQAALKTAQEFFSTLGRILEETGYYHHIPADVTTRLVQICTLRHKAEPRALGVEGTEILAFGKLVPTSHAPALEERLR